MIFAKFPTSSNTSKPKCNHPPSMKCPLCMDKSAPLGELKCNHGPGVKCPRCIGKEITGTGSWLCNHPPGTVCINCMNKGKSANKASDDSKSESIANYPSKCSHPSSMKCPNCMFKNESDKEKVKEKEKIEKKDENKTDEIHVRHLTPNCNHGPGGMCIYCMPKAFFT